LPWTHVAKRVDDICLGAIAPVRQFLERVRTIALPLSMLDDQTLRAALRASLARGDLVALQASDGPVATQTFNATTLRRLVQKIQA
jgi:hypothetical protein